jgi:hypothetical protein
MLATPFDLARVQRHTNLDLPQLTPRLCLKPPLRIECRANRIERVAERCVDGVTYRFEDNAVLCSDGPAK